MRYQDKGYLLLLIMITLFPERYLALLMYFVVITTYTMVVNFIFYSACCILSLTACLEFIETVYDICRLYTADHRLQTADWIDKENSINNDLIINNISRAK